MIDKTVEALRKRGYAAVAVATKEAALAEVLRAAEGAASVGWGGSETLKEIGAREALTASGREIRDHQTSMDVFFLSANALTEDGVIVNIDGTGNRIAASIYGPKKVVYVIGRNKIVAGGVEAAIRRAKSCACPPNCRRLGKRTPCGGTGSCAGMSSGRNDLEGCDSPDRICKVTAIFDRPPTRTPTTVILVDCDLGY